MSSGRSGFFSLHTLILLGLVLGAVFGILANTWRRLQRGWLAQSQLVTAEVFWYFVVGLWPVLYGVVYL